MKAEVRAPLLAALRVHPKYTRAWCAKQESCEEIAIEWDAHFDHMLTDEKGKRHKITKSKVLSLLEELSAGNVEGPYLTKTMIAYEAGRERRRIEKEAEVTAVPEVARTKRGPKPQQKTFVFDEPAAVNNNLAKIIEQNTKTNELLERWVQLWEGLQMKLVDIFRSDERPKIAKAQLAQLEEIRGLLAAERPQVAPPSPPFVNPQPAQPAGWPLAVSNSRPPG